MRGFTLIETVIYLALFAIVMTGLVATAYGYFETTGRNETKATLQEDKDFILGKINFALDGAQTVSAPALGSTGGTLTAAKYGGGSITITSSGSSVTQGGLTLNSTNVTIPAGSLSFTHFSTPVEGVTATFTISAKTPGGQSVSETASITRYVRK